RRWGRGPRRQRVPTAPWTAESVAIGAVWRSAPAAALPLERRRRRRGLRPRRQRSSPAPCPRHRVPRPRADAPGRGPAGPLPLLDLRRTGPRRLVPAGVGLVRLERV